MAKYKVFLKSGTVLEVEATTVDSNEVFVHFFQDGSDGRMNAGSFLIAEIFGFYLAGSVTVSSPIWGINHP